MAVFLHDVCDAGRTGDHYFEAEIEEVHQMAAQMIKKEYYQLLQSDEDEEKGR